MKPITIVGGGLAGLTLGIGLRQRGVPVSIWEAGRYPRHRVCGEFISGNGQAVLERLGLLARCHQAGSVYARTAMFVAGASRSPVRQLATPALCLSRHALDALLAGAFQQAGGDLHVNARWTAADPLHRSAGLRSGSLETGSSRAEPVLGAPVQGEGLVYASGRRTQPSEPSLWFGVKAHVSRRCPVDLEADLEMHLSRHGYIGVNRINDGEVNVCGLFQSRANTSLARGNDSSLFPLGERVGVRGKSPSYSEVHGKQAWLRGEPDSLLCERLRAAEFEPDSFCSVAGLQLNPQRASARAECCIGDALTMTPPVTGNGMSMAFESAELAIEPLAAYSQGRLDWPAARQQIARRCDAAFARRLAWARLLQWMMISPALHGRIGSALLRSKWLWRFMFARTR